MKAFVQPVHYDFHLTMSNPFILKLNTTLKKDHKIKPDIHYAMHLGILLEGRFEVIYEDSRLLINPGDVWFTAPWEPHSAIIVSDCMKALTFAVLPEKLGDIGLPNQTDWMLPFTAPIYNRPRVANDDMRTRVFHLAEEIVELVDNMETFKRSLSWLKLHELLIVMMEGSGFFKHTGFSIQNEALKRVLPAVKLARQTNNEVLTIDEAAKACGMGKSLFYNLFKTAIGTSFGKFYSRVRIGSSASDLLSANLPIKEIGEKWGFYDESHFCKTFRQYFHCSPKEFRSRNQ
ncbi:MAG: AraC family transcriptional regulator [Victivallaceae bacterium]